MYHCSPKFRTFVLPIYVSIEFDRQFMINLLGSTSSDKCVHMLFDALLFHFFRWKRHFFEKVPSDCTFDTPVSLKSTIQYVVEW